MKIVKLQSENVKRLTAVEIAPDGSLVTIGGKNGAGKSSVLDSIAMALGGKELVPSEPIRAGESVAKIVVDLGDLVVMRRFSRERGSCSCIPPGPPFTQEEAIAYQEACQNEPVEKHQVDCAKHRFGETKSTLTVANKDGARYPSPQAMLDRLLGRLTFDPLAFSREEPKRQAETLRRLAGLDLTEIDAERRAAAERRMMAKKSRDVAVARASGLPTHAEAPAEEIPVAEISAEMLRAEEARRAAEDAERKVDQTRSNGEQLERQRIRLSGEYDALHAQVVKKGEELAKCVADIDLTAHDLKTAAALAEEVRAAVPDAAAIRAKLEVADITNKMVRANKARAAADAEALRLQEEVDKAEETVFSIDAARELAIRSAKFPVEGLGVGDDGPTFGGLPFGQASSSEQLRVSVAIGLALNPTLKVLLVRNGNMLDAASLAALGRQAEEAGAQVWVEWVSDDGAGVSVMLEDGHRA